MRSPARIHLARILLPLTCAGMLALLLPGTASAHGEILGSIPANNEMLEAPPRTIEIRFSAAIEAKSAAVSVTSKDGHRLEQGRPAVIGGAVRIAVRTPAPFGQYTAAYRLMSADGHPVAGSVKYTVMPASSVLHPNVRSDAERSAISPGQPDMRLLWAWVIGGVLVGAIFIPISYRAVRSEQ